MGERAAGIGTEGSPSHSDGKGLQSEREIHLYCLQAPSVRVFHPHDDDDDYMYSIKQVLCLNSVISPRMYYQQGESCSQSHYYPALH